VKSAKFAFVGRQHLEHSGPSCHKPTYFVLIESIGALPLLELLKKMVSSTLYNVLHWLGH
jgi:hypothetical protein